MPRLLTKSAPIFVNIHGDMPVQQKDVSTQETCFWRSHHQSSLNMLSLAPAFVMRKPCMYMCDAIFNDVKCLIIL